jgi:hypothetical protein
VFGDLNKQSPLSLASQFGTKRKEPSLASQFGFGVSLPSYQGMGKFSL